MRAALTVAILLGASGRAVAEEEEVHQVVDVPPRNWVNLRAGGSNVGQDATSTICLELSPFERISVEGCGNGSGFLPHQNSSELAHFRAKGLLTSFPAAAGAWLQVHLSAGLAELQIGEDDPGFQFGGVGPRGVETAGFEMGASLRGIVPIRWGFELIGELRIDTAYLPHAPELSAPMNAWQPSAAVTVGIGF